MTAKRDHFLALLEKERRKVGHQRDPSYSAAVMPVLELYKGLTTFEERRAFQDALERLLSDEDAAKRRYAIDICLGFFVFRDAI